MTDLVRYIELIEQLVARKSDQELHGEAICKIIQNLFFYADEYYDDPEYTAVQKKNGDEELYLKAQRALGELRSL